MVAGALLLASSCSDARKVKEVALCAEYYEANGGRYLDEDDCRELEVSANGRFSDIREHCNALLPRTRARASECSGVQKPPVSSNPPPGLRPGSDGPLPSE